MDGEIDPIVVTGGPEAGGIAFAQGADRAGYRPFLGLAEAKGLAMGAALPFEGFDGGIGAAASCRRGL